MKRGMVEPTLETEENAENFLWSFCEGYTGDGWTKWDNTEVCRQLQEIRFLLKAYVDSDLYGRHCKARCRDSTPCWTQVSMDQLRCHHHRWV